MCGIAGILGINNASTYAISMLEAMHHRGPDDWGIYENGNVTLGHKRLSIIDLTSAGHQPMTSQNGIITMVYNGEIYNYQELKQLLPDDIQLKSNSDTEVILELWPLFGTELFPKLRGMFAIAIWDSSKRELILARDQMGIKPLYYQQNENQLIFSSEIKGLIASGLLDIKINKNAVLQYLNLGYIQQPQTILGDVNMLSPGSYIIWKEGKSTITKYWDINYKENITVASEKEAIIATRKLIINSVKEELISDRPVGLFLSGGLDSTILLACLKDIGIKNINTYSVSFDNTNESEIEDAILTAKFYNSNHKTINIEDSSIRKLIETHIEAIDQPSIDGFNTFLVSQAASKEVTVALSGLGGDELFSGYRIDRDIMSSRKYMLFFKIIRISKSLWRRLLPKKLIRRLEIYSERSSLRTYYNSWGQIFSEDEIRKVFHSSYINRISEIDLGWKYNFLQRISYLHQRTFMLSRLLRDGDSTSMYSSLEVRFPLIDIRLVNYVFNLPINWKIKNHNKALKHKLYEQTSSYKKDGIKHLLYNAFEDLLPQGFGTRPKRGFHFPIKRWLDTTLKNDVIDTLENSQYIPIDFSKKLLNSYYIKQNINWSKIWSIYILEKWIRKNIH